jgi:hypothetical protein
MIPRRDGNRLSAYLYFPERVGPWPAHYKQRCADLSAAAIRKPFASI